MLYRNALRFMVFIAIGLVGIWCLLNLALSLKADESIDSPEEYEVIDAMQRAKDAIALALESGEVTVLETALVDHPDYLVELPSEEIEDLRIFITRVLGPTAAANFGYLTAMKNKITYRLQGEAFVQAEIDKAKTARRAFTAADLQDLMRQHPDKHITMPRAMRPSVTSQPDERRYTSVKIDGDRARVTYEDVTSKTAILVRIDGKWYVAGIF